MLRINAEVIFAPKAMVLPREREWYPQVLKSAVVVGESRRQNEAF
jgi:hypothetical protein